MSSEAGDTYQLQAIDYLLFGVIVAAIITFIKHRFASAKPSNDKAA